MAKSTQFADLNRIGQNKRTPPAAAVTAPRAVPAPATPDAALQSTPQPAQPSNNAPDYPTRWRIDFRLTTLGLLHLGSGEDRQLTKAETQDDPDGQAAERPFAATLVCDSDGHPQLPGASLKGVLRQRAGAIGADPQWIARVFGCTREPNKDDARSTLRGNAEFRAACWRSGQDKSLEVRTAIDRCTQTVADGKLFHEEVVLPGAEFVASIVLPWAEAVDVARLQQLLNGCSAADPLRIGAHTRAGWGAVQISGVQVHAATRESLQAWWDEPLPDDGSTSGWREPTTPVAFAGQLQGPGATAPGQTLTLKLTLQFDGPFAVRDPAHRKVKGDDQPNALPRERHGKPLLPATSFLGALRSRAECILRTLGVVDLPQGHAAKPVRTGEQPEDDLASLLFGCAGWRGLVGTTGDFIGEPGSQRMTQHMVALCRITGGGQDGAKFAFECWESPELVGHLTFDQRRFAPLKATPKGLAALGLLHLVLAELAYGDIGFGMARSKGWGWVTKNDQLLGRLETGWWPTLGAARTTGGAQRPIHQDLLRALHQHTRYAPPENHDLPMPANVPHPTSPPTEERPPTLFRKQGEADSEFHNPYHFLPFAQLQPAADGACSHHHDRWHEDHHSGHFKVTLTTITPLYIGGELIASTDRKKANQSRPFTYGRDRWRAIPGTSLRGMLSSLLEPMSGSAMRVIDADRTLSVRMPAETGRGLPFHGVVHMQTDEEGEFHVVHDDGGNVWAIDPDAEAMLHALADERWQAKGEKLKLPTPSGDKPPKLHVARNDRKDRNGRYDPTKKGQVDLLPAIDCEGTDTFRPDLRNPNPEKWGTRARLMPGQEVWFRLDSTNTHIAEIAWSGLFRKSAWVAGVADPGPLTLKRLMMANGQGDRLPLGLRGDNQQLHGAEWLLGVVERRPTTGQVASGTATAFASKLSISVAQAEQRPKTGAPVTLKELSSPKPPSPSLYIRPSTGRQRPTSKMDLIDNPAGFRFQGTKAYLHALRRDGQTAHLSSQGLAAAVEEPPWQSQRPAQDISNRQITVTPIQAGESFTFTVRFTNLSSDELSMVCAAFQPSENFEHKLGMGRPIGLGSVKLKIDALRVIERHRRLGDGCQAHQDLSPLAMAAKGMANLKDSDEQLWRAMLLLGEPLRVHQPVHYPQVNGQPIETENYKWWVANDKLGASAQTLCPLDEPPRTPAPSRSPR